jgi:hypothetical protein
MKISSAGPSIPVVSIGDGSFFAMQVGVHGHALAGFKFVYQVVGPGPISLNVPTESSHRRGELRGWIALLDGVAKLDHIHGIDLYTWCLGVAYR